MSSPEYNKAYQKQLRTTPEGRARLQEYARRERNTPQGKFREQRKLAQRRGIEFLFTFEEWIEWWGEDFDRRGPGADRLCMARHGDTGPYAPWNVRKATNRENQQEAHKGRIHSKETRAKMSVSQKLRHEQRKSK